MSEAPSQPEPDDFSWLDFQELSLELLDRPCNEAVYRTIVGRSYYAVYNFARGVLDRSTPEFRISKGHATHRQVWEAIRAHPSRQAKSAVRSGMSMLRERTAADYKLSGSDWARRAEQAVTQANRAIATLSDLNDKLQAKAR